jgi:hypothetical protein
MVKDVFNNTTYTQITSRRPSLPFTFAHQRATRLTWLWASVLASYVDERGPKETVAQTDQA